MSTTETERLDVVGRQTTRSWSHRAGRWLVPIAGVAAVLVASFALLELGLPSASSGERFAVATFRTLDFTRGSGAVMDVNGRRLVAHCRTYPTGRVVITLSNRQRLLVIGTNIYALPQLLARRHRDRRLFARQAVGLLAAEADLAGSHRLYARELAAALANITIPTRPLTYAGHPAYALTLSRKPSLILVVAQHGHKPIAALYHSTAIRASSRLLKELPASAHEPGC